MLLITADLMTGSQVPGATTCLPASATQRIADEPPAVILIDLAAPGVDAASIVAAAGNTPVIAFGPHVHEAKLRAARDAGCTAVLTRGQFFRDPAAVIARYADSGEA